MIRNINSFMPRPEIPLNNTRKSNGSSFANTLKELVQDVNSMQIESKNMNEAFIRGDVEDLHQVTLTAEKARIGFELLLEIRNKLLEGYKEIMRMPI